MGKELVGQRFALGAKLSRARQYRYSASKPLSDWQKRHVSHQGGSQNRARRSMPYREIQARDYHLNSWRTIWNRFCDDPQMALVTRLLGEPQARLGMRLRPLQTQRTRSSRVGIT